MLLHFTPKNFEGTTLYRLGDYIGPGSFWAENPEIAYEYGKGKAQKITVGSDPVVDLKYEDDLENLLMYIGVDPDDAIYVYENSEWMEQPYLNLLATHFAWLRKPIADTYQIEWVMLRPLFKQRKRLSRGPAKNYEQAKTDLQLKIEQLMLHFIEDSTYEGVIEDPSSDWYGQLSQATWDLVDMVDMWKKRSRVFKSSSAR